MNERLAAIENRLVLIERRLASVPPPLSGKREALQRVVTPAPMTAAALPSIPAPYRRPPVTTPFTGAPPFSDQAISPLQIAPPQIPGPAIVPVRPIAYEPKRTIPAMPQGSLEQTIGLKWAGWIGAVVLVIGAGLGIKFAYDQGWLGGLPAPAKLVLLWMAGFTLIGTGEWVYRRVNTISAAGLYGAGVAMLFLVSYAGHGYFGVYARDTAFVLMGVSTLVGAAVSMRGKLVSIAVLSLIGGHAAPVILGGKVTTAAPFLSYLVGLQIVAIVLAWWGAAPRWWTLRTVSLVATALWMTGLIASSHRSTIDQTAILLAFLLTFAGLYQLELVLSAMKRARSATPAHADDGAGVVFSMIVTALLTAGVLVIRQGSPESVRGAWVVGLAVIHGALGFVLTRAARRDTSDADARARHPVYRLAIGYRVQAMILLIVAVPAAFSGAFVVLGWAMMATALAVVGVRLDLVIARRTAAVTWMLSVGYLLLWTVGRAQSSHAADATWTTFLGQPLPAYWFSALGLTVVGHLVALLLPIGIGTDNPRRIAEEMRRSSYVIGGLAGLTLLVASIAALPPLAATAVAALYAWLLLGGDFARPGAGLVQQAAAVIALAVVKWACVDCLADRLSPAWSVTAHPVLLNPMMLVGVLLSGTLVGVGWLRRDVLTRVGGPDTSADARRAILFLATSVVIMMTIGLSFEIDRQFESPRNVVYEPQVWRLKHLAWTMLWSVSVCALLGITHRVGAGRYRIGDRLNVLGAVAVLLLLKFLLLDTLGYRINDGPAVLPLPANLQRLAAVVVVGMLILARALTRGFSPVSGMAGFGATFVVLWIVSFEIDRAAVSQTIAAPWVFRQVGWSVCWSIFAVLSVAVGFRIRLAPLRYFGLALFGITLLKVVLIDLSAASTGYRILSFLGLGALLLGTSVLYGKVSPILLGMTPPKELR